MRNVSKRYGGVVALKGVDFAMEPGEVHCLLGENGSGKSTLIKIMTGVERPGPGSVIEIDGIDGQTLTPRLAAAQGIQVIYQDLSLFPNLTVGENIALSELLDVKVLRDRGAVRRIASRTMASIGVKLDLDRLVADLRIADRQLVAICRALSAEARLIIMDEPTASLTAAEVRSLLSLVASLRDRGVAILFVSHKLEEIMEVAQRVSILRDGELISTQAIGELDPDRLSVLMTGKSFQYQSPEPIKSDAPPVLRLDNLSRAGEFADVSLAIQPGEVFGITGLLGSGRTELAQSIFGLTAPDSGRLEIAGRAVTFKSNRDAIREGIAYVPEDRIAQGLVMPQSIADNMILTVLDRHLDGLGMLRSRAMAETADRWLKELHIKAPQPGASVDTLSGGNQQRVVLAKWMARSPRVLILDNPTVGVDVSAKDGIYSIIQRLSERGVAIILITDEIGEALRHSHRVAVMKEGRIIAVHECAQTTVEAVSDQVHA